MHSLFNFKHQKSFDGIFETIINEGHYASYSIGKLFEVFENKFEQRININYDDTLKGITKTSYGLVGSFQLHLKNPQPRDVSFIEQTLKVYGYYISDKAHEPNLFEALVEPRVPQEISSILQQTTNTLYHITHKSNLDKIKKIGIAPRETETSFLHPGDRIYLVWSQIHIVKALKKTLAKNKNLPDNEFVVLSVPFSDKYKYFIDDTTTNLDFNPPYIGCFITKNIPPQEVTQTNI